MRRRGELTFTKIDLPHDWLIGDSEKLYEDGDGWYRRALDWHGEGSHAFLTCEGILQWTAASTSTARPPSSGSTV